jgi:hypothetical protein
MNAGKKRIKFYVFSNLRLSASIIAPKVFLKTLKKFPRFIIREGRSFSFTVEGGKESRPACPGSSVVWGPVETYFFKKMT